MQIVTEKLPRTERGVFDKLYSGTRGFRRYRDVQKEAVSRFGSTGLGNLTITDISTLTRQGKAQQACVASCIQRDGIGLACIGRVVAWHLRPAQHAT